VVAATTQLRAEEAGLQQAQRRLQRDRRALAAQKERIRQAALDREVEAVRAMLEGAREKRAYAEHK